MADFVRELGKAVQTGLFNERIASSADCIPRILVNKKGEKIGECIKNELKQCDSF